MQALLPPDLVRRLDLSTLTIERGSYVNASLQWRHSDLLLSTQLDGRDSFVYILAEHQSRTDPLMAFRMLHYMVLIWDDYVRENPDAKRLPAILPVVVHHNHRAWSAPTEPSELIDLDPASAEAAREYLPRFRFLLDDLAKVDEDALRARPLAPLPRLMLVLLKTALGNHDLATDLWPWAGDLLAVMHGPTGWDDLTSILTYIHYVAETPAEQLHRLFARLGPQAEEAYVTTADMLRAEGEVRGRAKGRAEGEVRGRAEGRAEALLQLLTIKFGQQGDATIDVVHAATPEQLEAWTGRVLTADTIDDVLN